MEFVNCFSSHLVCSAERPSDVPGKRSHRGSRKRDSNPYAERGLDQFAVLSAELEAKRKKLVAQLGTQLSFVRFAIGSDHRDWIPIIICPTLSKAEIRKLERTATRLIAEDDHAVDHAQHAHMPQNPIRESQIAKEHVLGDDRPARVSAAHVDDAQNGTLHDLVAASERCLCMVLFICSITADIISNVFSSKWHATEAPPQRSLPSSTTGRFKQEGDNPSSSNIMPSSLNAISLPHIRTPASAPAKAVKVIAPTHASAHARTVAKPHNRHQSAGISTAPSTPRDSRQQAKKSFQASISFPTKSHLPDEALHSGTANNSKLSKSLSLPKVSRVPEHAVQRSSTTSKAKQAALEREKRERSERLGQALTGMSLALGLGSLVMGYIPAILCVACWWYALPSLRMAVGDKPHVRSHHHR